MVKVRLRSAVVAAGFGAKGVVAFDHQNLAPALRQLRRRSQSYDTGPGNPDFGELFHERDCAGGKQAMQEEFD